MIYYNRISSPAEKLQI